MYRPNIILITAAGLRHDCLGSSGNPDVRTPNIDALAAHGVRFQQAITPSTDPLSARLALLGAMGDNPQQTASLPAVLQRLRYDTALVGAWGGPSSPENFGFGNLHRVDQVPLTQEGNSYHRWLAAQGQVDRIAAWSQGARNAVPPVYERSFGTMRSNLDERHHVTTWIGNQAVRHIQRVDGPFFLWASFTKPAPPFDPPTPWAERYNPAALVLPSDFCLPIPQEDTGSEIRFDPRTMTEARFRRVLAYYYANISHLDHQVGRILATLTARGITNNIIVFCGTHGDFMGQHGLVGGAPGRPMESLLRVPLIFGGKGGQRRGALDAALVRLDDVPATLLDVVGMTETSHTSRRSLVTQLQTPDAPLREAATAECAPGQRVVRNAREKLVISEAPGLCAYYDLEEDPGEYDNRYSHPGNAQCVARLRRFLA